MKLINTTLALFDRFQQRHRTAGFIYAVIKKYGEDEAGYQAALLTYYGFLSVFPLLLVLTTVTSFLAHSHPGWQDTIIKSMTDYFPVLGNQLSEHVHSLNKNGLALAIGLLFTLYGARGVADSFRHGVNHIWQVPRVNRQGFPKSLLTSLMLIVVSGLGLLLASIGAASAANIGHGWGFRILSFAVDIFLLFWLFDFLLNICLPRHVTIKQARSGALTAAVGLVILQAFGGYLLGRELKNLDALYSSFAITLGLLFWIYLQAQVLYYAVEVSAVKAEKLWPRSLQGNLTPADRKAYARLASKEKIVSQEHIATSFDR
jgi:YihY family inner membrane protein